MTSGAGGKLHRERHSITTGERGCMTCRKRSIGKSRFKIARFEAASPVGRGS
jgi:hypothetical protein